MLISVNQKQADMLDIFKVCQNTEQLVTIRRLKNALSTVDHVILYLIVVLRIFERHICQ